MRALLDVNVLIALLDAAHIHHREATRWLAANLASGWASTPITQNGCIRVMSQSAYRSPLPAAQVAQRLAAAAAQPPHAFWPDSVSLLEAGRVDWSRLLGHRQVTDAYLLALAVAQGGRFVTLDRRIDAAVVPGAEAERLVAIVG
jgi:toxin-antitoxin system PIN domain toxin